MFVGLFMTIVCVCFLFRLAGAVVWFCVLLAVDVVISLFTVSVGLVSVNLI